MKPKEKPKGNEIWTRNHVHLSPLNVVATQMSVKDVAFALSRQPMFGGHSAFEYNKAHHSVRICDRIREDSEYYLDRTYKNTNTRIYKLPLRKIRLLSLFYMSHHAYLEPIMGRFPAFEVHKSRVIAACLEILGEEFTDFQACIKLFDFVDKEIKDEMYDRFYDITCKDVDILDNHESYKEFMARIEALRKRD